MAISGTPADCAGTAVISTVEGYAAAPPRHADSHSLERVIPLPQRHSRAEQFHVAMQNGILKLANIVPDLPHRCEKLWPGLGVSGFQFGSGNTHRLRG